MTSRSQRNVKLKDVLEARRRHVQQELDSRLLHLRRDHPDSGRDTLDASDDATRRDLEQALLEMSWETIARIDAALLRFDAGDYGVCAECDGDIAVERLQALPFAIRCRVCEQTHEDRPAGLSPVGPRPGSLGDYADGQQS